MSVPRAVWRCTIVFFCYRHFLFVFLVLLCAFLMKRNCAHAFFQHFFAPNAGVPPTSFYVQKMQKILIFGNIGPALHESHEFVTFFSRPGGQIVAWLQRLHHRKISPRITAPNRRPPGTSSLACRRWSFGSGRGIKVKYVN